MTLIKDIGLQSYTTVWEDMKHFTSNRTNDTEDELWLVEHLPVYTQGQAGKKEHVLNQGNIPVVQTDRGGQVTYHGPGQMVAYVLFDIQRRHLGVRTLVLQLEQIIIQLLDHFQIEAQTRCGAPGVYVNEKKIASIGLRVKGGCTYHGIALNVAMDLSPFSGINPCGFSDLAMTQMCDLNQTVEMSAVKTHFTQQFLSTFEL